MDPYNECYDIEGRCSILGQKHLTYSTYSACNIFRLAEFLTELNERVQEILYGSAHIPFSRKQRYSKNTKGSIIGNPAKAWD